MRTVLRLVAGGAATIVVCCGVLPLLVVAVIAGEVRQASLLASRWDIPPELVPVFQEAGQTAGIPWFLLAATASVATDFGRHGPDGRTRGDAVGSSIYPVIAPPILSQNRGAGMFLVDPSRAGPGSVDPQDDRAAADWLAQALAALDLGHAHPNLAEPDAARFWVGIVISAPLLIAAVAPSGDAPRSVAPGSDGNPIRQFGAALLATIGAPVTTTNLDAIDAWAAGEGSCARFNPLDTTQPEPGATPFNTLPGGGHVWNYVSFDQGVEATSSTLRNGLYQPVIAALQTDAGVAAVERAVRQSPWGTGQFGSPAYAGPKCDSSSPAPGPPVVLPTIDGPNGIAATIVARAAHYQSVWGASLDLGTTGTGAPGPVTGVGATYVLPVDGSWFQAHPDWLQRPHHDFPAIDIPVPAGNPVYAVVAGQVVASDEAGGATSCGHDVRLFGRDGAVYTYCHGSAVLVPNGQQVDAGQLIMRSGWSGSVVPPGPVGAHLHFQIDIPGRPGPVCPQPALAAWAAGRAFDPHQLPSGGCVAGHVP